MLLFLLHLGLIGDEFKTARLHLMKNMPGDAFIDLPLIDRLEAFDPNGRSMFQRVLVAVESNDFIQPVWLYRYNLGHNAERIPSGKWF
jgi:hypothetical protein